MNNYNELLPEEGVSVIAKSEKWVDELNPKGIRIGFRQDDIFISAYYDNYQDCFETDESTLPDEWLSFERLMFMNEESKKLNKMLYV